jgi:hypothetical protein
VGVGVVGEMMIGFLLGVLELLGGFEDTQRRPASTTARISSHFNITHLPLQALALERWTEMFHTDTVTVMVMGMDMGMGIHKRDRASSTWAYDGGA